MLVAQPSFPSNPCLCVFGVELLFAIESCVETTPIASKFQLLIVHLEPSDRSVVQVTMHLDIMLGLLDRFAFVYTKLEAVDNLIAVIFLGISYLEGSDSLVL
jgi:hypothetical protein